MATNTPNGNDVYVFQRESMIAGNPNPTMIGFNNPNRPSTFDNFHCILPLDNDGPWAPSGTPGQFITIADDGQGNPADELWIYELDVDWQTPSNSTFTRTQTLTVNPFDGNFDGTWENIPQPGTSQQLDGISTVLMHRAQYRNFNGTQKIVCNHTIAESENEAAIRWYELENIGSGWYIAQQGTYNPDNISRWNSSIAMNDLGEIAMAYSVSDGSSTYPGIRCCAQTNSAPSGVMDVEETVILDGTYSQTQSNRWGDYSNMSIDPTDGKTFWFTSQYKESATHTKGTRIAAFSLGIEVALDQQREDGTRLTGTTIGRWNGSSFDEITITSPPPTITSAPGTQEVLRGYQQLVTGPSEKYRVWERNGDEQLDNVQNHRGFTIAPDDENLTSRFHRSYDGITIRNELLSAPGADPEGDVVEFKDPWLIDSTDTNHENNPLNRGLQAIFRTQESPFNPDYTNPHNGFVYQGVFLDQGWPNWNPPYYSVRARQQQTIPFHGEDIIWYFQGWGGTDVQFEHPNQTETAVVFKQADAVAQAQYKGHLASDTQDATAGNNTHKVIAEYDKGDNHNPQNLYMVYIEDGKLYFTESSDGGDGWNKEVLLDGSDQYECLNPGIGVDRNLNVHIVYERKSFDVWTDYRVFYKMRDITCVWQTVDLSGENHRGYNEPTTPSIYVGYYGDVYVAWRYSQMQGATGGIVLRTIDYRNPNPSWSSYLYVPDTDLSSYLPSCGFPANESSPTNNIGLTWRQESRDDIFYISGGYGNENENWQWSSTMSLAGDISCLARNDRPSMYYRVTHTYNNYVVWQGIKGLSPEKSKQGNERPPVVCIREKDSTGWLPMEIFVVENTSDRNPVVTAFEYEEGEDYGVAYQESEREVRYFTRPDGSNYEQTLSGDGVNPAITTLQEIPIACWTEYHTPPYLLKHAALEIEEKRNGSEEIPHRRILSFNLQNALSGSHLLNMNADLGLEMADPEIVTPLGNRKLKFSFSHSTLNAQNAFTFQPYLVSSANSRLRIPVDIMVQNFSMNKNELASGNDLPFWNLRIKDAATNQVLALVRIYHTGHLTGNHSGNFVLSDTFEVDLSPYLGKNIQLEGVTYLLKNAPHVGLAELYDLRRTAPLEKQTLAFEETQMLPAAYHLYQNYPNPFNPSTTISFNLPEESRVSLEIYDITGRKIRTLANGRYPAGSNRVVWDGTDSRGQAVASGVYVYRLSTDEHVTTRKLLLMK